MSHQKSSDYKETAVQYYLIEDKTQEEVCKIFKCSPRSLMRWVDKYKKDGEITGYNRIPKAYKVHKEHVPYQHFTNSIENYFSMLKSRLQKLDGLTHTELKNNISKVLENIPKEKYRNIFKGAYERPEKYVSNKKT